MLNIEEQAKLKDTFEEGESFMEASKERIIAQLELKLRVFGFHHR